MTTRFKRIYIGASLLFLFALLYLPYIHRTMQCDEASTLYKYASSLPFALLSYTTPNNHILHSVLVCLITTFAGISQVSVRFVAFMSALLSLVMSYRLGNRLYGFNAGIAASAILMTSIGFISYATDARGYTLSAFLTLSLIELVFISRQQATRKYNYLLMLHSFALLLLIPSMFLLLAPILLWILWRWNKTGRRYWINSIMAIIVGGIASSLFYLPSVLTGAAGRYLSTFGESGLASLINNWLSLTAASPILNICILIGLVVGFIVCVQRGSLRPLLAGICLIFGIAIIVAPIQYILTGHTLYARNYFYLLPVMSVISGIGFAHILKRFTIPVVIVILLVFIPANKQQLEQTQVVDEMVKVIETYGEDGNLLIQDSCQYTAVYYEITEKRQEKMPQWQADSSDKHIILTYRPGPLEVVLKNNDLSIDDYAQCYAEQTNYHYLDLFICEK